LFQHVTTQDFIEYGFEPEFIGRLPVRVVCEELDANDLFDIMKFSEGSLLRQYERAFRAYGIEISFEDEALRLLAQAAATDKTGARGLLTVFERLFRDYKFHLAGSGLSQLRVSAALVREPQHVLEQLMAEGHKLEAQMLEERLEAFRIAKPSRLERHTHRHLRERRRAIESSGGGVEVAAEDRRTVRRDPVDYCRHLPRTPRRIPSAVQMCDDDRDRAALEGRRRNQRPRLAEQTRIAPAHRGSRQRNHPRVGELSSLFHPFVFAIPKLFCSVTNPDNTLPS